MHWSSLVLALLALAGGMFVCSNREATLRGAWPSPDGRFEVRVYSLSRGGFAMPGQGSDGEGMIVLVDRTRERIIAMRELDTVQAMTQVRWERCRVKIRLLANWPLPTRAGQDCSTP